MYDRVIKSKNKVKRHLGWEKIIANGTTDEALISKIYKKLNARKNKQPSPKGTEDLNRHFSKKHIQMTNKHEKMLNIAHY